MPARNPDDELTPEARYRVEVDAVIDVIDTHCSGYSVGAIITACRRVADGLEQHLPEVAVTLHRLH